MTPPAKPVCNAAAAGKLLARIRARTPEDGLHASPWPGLNFLRASQTMKRTPIVYQPCLCIVAQGNKRAYLGNRVFQYDRLHYLMLSVPLPVESEITQASLDKPFLSLKLDINVNIVSELMLEICRPNTTDSLDRPRRGIFASPMSDVLLDAILRLIDTLDDPDETRVLAPLAEREVLYRLLTGDQGDRLRAMAVRDSRSQRIFNVLRFIHQHYAKALDVASIAEQAAMSPSTLHSNFKSVTSVSPMQYLKSIRLHQARLLMLQRGITASQAAHQVGYSSSSQFSREFKRLFGAPPSSSIGATREILGGRSPSSAAVERMDDLASQ